MKYVKLLLRPSIPLHQTWRTVRRVILYEGLDFVYEGGRHFEQFLH